jgi:UDPglucose 6-dehydrogenase
LKITIAGIGYVGIANGLLFAQYHDVTMYDINPIRVDFFKNHDVKLINKFDKTRGSRTQGSIQATCDSNIAYDNPELVIICTPTDLLDDSESFSTTSIEAALDSIVNSGSSPLIIIKSTVPIGYTARIRDKYSAMEIEYSPEFLRETSALEDVMRPSRVVVSNDTGKAEILTELLREIYSDSDVKFLSVRSSEAEAIKLFSNSFLALRVAFFNELDTFSAHNELAAASIIKGISLDPRIGDFYNNPSFGYGGYCLPKDSRQLNTNFGNIPHPLIRAVIESNEARLDFIVDELLRRGSRKIFGIYRLVAKKDSDNVKSSISLKVAEKLLSKQCTVFIFEPLLNDAPIAGVQLINDLLEFKRVAEIVITNRYSDELFDIKDKLFTRDITGEG